jgi:hypothetical protein
MNERLQELAEQAGYKPLPGFNFANSLEETYLKKFAELIVRECVDKIESKRSSGENTDQWTITRDMCYHDMMRELKEHFGVE